MIDFGKLKNQFLSKIRKNHVPKNNLIIFCNPRSGSTWLFDMLRCHTNIVVEEKCGFYNEFNLFGRRYPRDLSNGIDGILPIEIRPGLVEKIPEFSFSEKVDELSYNLPTYSLEKIHPEYFSFSPEGFVEKLERYKAEGYIFQFILLVRDPISSFSSFQNYQSRNPEWFKGFSEKQLASYTRKTFESLDYFNKRFGGMVIKYDDLFSKKEEIVSRIYNLIWAPSPYIDSSDMKKHIDESWRLTRREKRQKSGTSFLGQKVGKVEDNEAFLNGLEPNTIEQLKYCQEIYESIIV